MVLNLRTLVFVIAVLLACGLLVSCVAFRGSKHAPTEAESESSKLSSMTGRVVFSSEDFDWNDHRQPVYFAIWMATHQALLAKLESMTTEDTSPPTSGPPFECVAQLTVDRTGQIIDVTLTTSSQVGVLDAACLGVASAILPPLPEEFPRDTEKITLSMHAEEIPGREELMKLRQLRARGLF